MVCGKSRALGNQLTDLVGVVGRKIEDVGSDDNRRAFTVADGNGVEINGIQNALGVSILKVPRHVRSQRGCNIQTGKSGF